MLRVPSPQIVYGARGYRGGSRLPSPCSARREHVAASQATGVLRNSASPNEDIQFEQILGGTSGDGQRRLYGRQENVLCGKPPGPAHHAPNGCISGQNRRASSGTGGQGATGIQHVERPRGKGRGERRGSMCASGSEQPGEAVGTGGLFMWIMSLWEATSTCALSSPSLP
jgi:hypothetical protein